MYGYEELLEVTAEQLLQKVTQQEIFSFILKKPFNFADRYLSPFRDDKRPDCRFEERSDGAILFVDFGERFINPEKTHRSCFGMVMDYYNTSLNGAIRIICDQFGLSKNPKDYDTVTTITYQVSSVREKIPTTITYDRIPFTKLNTWFWSQFSIKIDHLVEDHVFSTNKFRVKSEKGVKTINVYKHAYVFDFIDKVKIYQPFSEKYKWITNCDENTIGNIDNLPPTGDELIIKKSYKDHRVLRNLDLGLNVIWFQNEGVVPEMEILVNLTQRFKLITVFYDNDEDGIKAAQKLVDIFNMIRPDCARMVYLPRRRKDKRLYGNYLKDPAEFYFREGKLDLIKVLKQIGINGKE